MTLMTVSAGLVLSIACAVLVEEVILGRLFRLFFAPPPVSLPQPKPNRGKTSRDETSEETDHACL